MQLVSLDRRRGRRWHLLTVLTFVVALLAVGSPVTYADVSLRAVDCNRTQSVFTIYLHPNGDDGNDGRWCTPSRAVRTLEGAEQVLHGSDPDSDVEIRIVQGTYRQPPMSWRTYVPGHEIRFMPVDYDLGESYRDIAGRPVFRGTDVVGCWMAARLPKGHPGGNTNLEFYYLHVERYARCGLFLQGGTGANRHGITVPTDKGVNDNKVFGMMFRAIGTTYVDVGARSPGYAAIQTYNSSSNLIKNNHFVRLRNRDAPGTAVDENVLIHGVYLAQHSNDNMVRRNNFRVIGGNPVRTRNSSNGNIFKKNRFKQAGDIAYYQEWFCAKTCMERNDKQVRECPSYGNYFVENRLVSGLKDPSIADWDLHPSNQWLKDYPGNINHCPDDSRPRLRTWSNTGPDS